MALVVVNLDRVSPLLGRRASSFSGRLGQVVGFVVCDPASISLEEQSDGSDKYKNEYAATRVNGNEKQSENRFGTRFPKREYLEASTTKMVFSISPPPTK